MCYLVEFCVKLNLLILAISRTFRLAALQSVSVLLWQLAERLFLFSSATFLILSALTGGISR
jgi:hypothetical protein